MKNLCALLAAGLLWQLAACSGTTVPAAPLGGAAGSGGGSGGGGGSGLGRPVGNPQPRSGGPAGGWHGGPRYGAHCAAPPVIAHRGEGGTIAPVPENSAIAELAALRQGASLLDVDVRWTSDDVPVVIHDPTLNRTTTGSGPVASVTAAQFTALGVRTNDGRRVLPRLHPQTLAQLLAALKGTETRRNAAPIIVQMEADPFAGGAGQSSINALISVIAASGYGGKIVVGGWSADDVSAFSASAPGIRTAYIQESGNPSAASIRAAGASILYIDFAKLTPSQVAAWHRGGITVWAWTPAHASQWARLRTMGVDAIATNWVGSYTHWARPCAAVLPK